MRSESQARTLDAALLAAPFVANVWHTAVAQLARATGGWSGELIGISKSQGLVFNIEHGHSADELRRLGEHGLYLGGTNPRIAAFEKAGAYQVMSEPDFISREDRMRSAFYQDALRPLDADLSCIVRLQSTLDLEIGFCVVRAGAKGDFSPDDRAGLHSAMAPLDAAVRLHIAVEQRGAELAGRAFESLGAAAFLFDRAGRVIALSEAAVHMVRRQEFLRLSHGALTAINTASNTKLQRAIAENCAPAGPLQTSQPVVLRGAEDVIAVEITRVPPDGTSFGQGAAAILVVPRDGQSTNARPTIAAAYGLTAAESDVTLMISEGLDVGAVAARRHSSPQTVRSQLKIILAKTGARSQTHLAAIIARVIRL